MCNSAGYPTQLRLTWAASISADRNTSDDHDAPVTAPYGLPAALLPTGLALDAGDYLVTVATITDWLDRLQGVRKAGNGYKARCPAHDDKNPSLSVTEGTDDKVLVTCFAGCTFEAIRDALWPGYEHRSPGCHSDVSPRLKLSAGTPCAARRPARYGLQLPLRGRVRGLCLRPA